MGTHINAPVKGGNVTALWRTVEQLCNAVNSLLDAKVYVEKIGSEEKSSGRIIPADANTVLHLRLAQGGGLPPFDDLDTSKKYAVIAEFTDGDWKAKWKEICSS